MVFGGNCSLLLGAGVQLVVFCITIKAQIVFRLFLLGGHGIINSRSFILLLEMRLESLFFCLPYTVVFIVTFPVVVINSYCQSIYVLKQGRFTLFLGGDRILDPVWKILVIVVVQNTIPST